MKYQIVLDRCGEANRPLFEVDVDRFDDLTEIELRAAVDCQVPVWRIRAIEEEPSFHAHVADFDDSNLAMAAD
jgi:hypothetical protein